MVTSTGWGFAAMAGIFTAMACGSHDANINPAVTLALGIVTHDFSKLLPYIAAQTLGAFVGSVLVWLHFLSHWKPTQEPILKLSCFCSHPAIPHKAANFVCEVIATTLLVFVGACIARLAQICRTVGFPSSLPHWLGPTVAGCLHHRVEHESCA